MICKIMQFQFLKVNKRLLRFFIIFLVNFFNLFYNIFILFELVFFYLDFKDQIFYQFHIINLKTFIYYINYHR